MHFNIYVLRLNECLHYVNHLNVWEKTGNEIEAMKIIAYRT